MKMIVSYVNNCCFMLNSAAFMNLHTHKTMVKCS